MILVDVDPSVRSQLFLMFVVVLPLLLLAPPVDICSSAVHLLTFAFFSNWLEFLKRLLRLFQLFRSGVSTSRRWTTLRIITGTER